MAGLRLLTSAAPASSSNCRCQLQRRDDARPAAATTAARTETPQRRPRILVLDDEQTIAELLGEMLGLLRFTTRCHSAPDALRPLAQRDFD
jgi:hypothetical protein